VYNIYQLLILLPLIARELPLMYNTREIAIYNKKKENIMSRIESFKTALEEKRAVKIISGIDNFDTDKIAKVVRSADMAGAHAIDICAAPNIISMVRSMTNLPIFVSSVVPEELVRAVELGADAIELGNFDALYKKGKTFSAAQVFESAKKVSEMLSGSDVFFCVTIPGELEIGEQINLARKLEELGIDLIQTEGHFTAEPSNGAKGLLERAELTISNTIELTRNIELPVMTATGINPTTASLAFAAGASAIGCGSCVNKLDSEISMVAVIKNLVDIASRNTQRIKELV